MVPSSTLLFGTSNAGGGNDSTAEINDDTLVEEGSIWDCWSDSVGISAPKLSIRPPTAEERGKGGVFASEDISALEVITRIPSNLIVTAKDAPTRAIEAAANANDINWAAELTAAAIVALHPEANDNADESVVPAKQSWASSWQAGGWATDSSDLRRLRFESDEDVRRQKEKFQLTISLTSFTESHKSQHIVPCSAAHSLRRVHSTSCILVHGQCFVTQLSCCRPSFCSARSTTYRCCKDRPSHVNSLLLIFIIAMV